MQEISELGAAFHTIANSLCDLVTVLSVDLRLRDDGLCLRSFFGEDVNGVSFHEFLSASDYQRFEQTIKSASGLKLPGCVAVTLLRRGNLSPLEASLVVAPTMGTQSSYILGIALSKEELLLSQPASNVRSLIPSCLGRRSEALDIFSDASAVVR